MADLISNLTHQEGTIPGLIINCPAERYNEVYCDNTGCHTVGSDGLSRVWDSNTSPFDWKIGDRSPGDLGCGPPKEGWEELLLKHVLYGLEGLPNVQGNALHKRTLLLEGLL